ncbi:MAG: nitronate monooxygenase [Bacteroidia bacterium]|nr:nitronate monooxygenase [Bacteroidia bacterium]
MQTALTELLGCRYPVILAPMFLVSNAKMCIAALKAGISPCLPAHNYRTDEEFRKAIQEIKSAASGPLGINLITNKSNLYYESQLKTCVELKVDYIITSLGSPEKVIRACKPAGIKVICDVIDEQYAKKVELMGADALIAVNNLAGGHAGKLPPEVLIPLLLKNCKLPVISAGGVGNHAQMKAIMDMGACGVSVGSPYIATVEAPVNHEYKQALVDYGEEDIVMTTKISGTPCAVINTPYVQKIGTKQNWLERVLNNNKRLKKWAKVLTFYKGMKALEKAAFGATYQTVWCAGKSIEHVHSIRTIEQVTKELMGE